MKTMKGIWLNSTGTSGLALRVTTGNTTLLDVPRELWMIAGKPPLWRLLRYWWSSR